MLDKVLAVLEDAELLRVVIASHLAQRCTFLQPEKPILYSLKVLIGIKHFLLFVAALPASCWAAQISDFTGISLSEAAPTVVGNELFETPKAPSAPILPRLGVFFCKELSETKTQPCMS